MKAIADRQISPADQKRRKDFDGSSTVLHIRRLIWLYLLLLIFEGALRKWVVPQFSAPLLLVRDPVVVAIYMLALRARLFPQNMYVTLLEVIALLCWATGIIVLLPLYSFRTAILVTGFGIRSDFLHLPLIFIIPEVLTLEDVKRLGRWTMIGMVPTALLMAWQFAATPESFVNRAAGLGEGLQIQAGGGRVRPPGLFSFVSGTIYYSSAVAAFLLHAILAKLPYRNWLLGASGGALIVGLGVSGSRSAVLAVGVVVASVGIILLIHPSLVSKALRQLLLAVIVIWAISYVPIFREGLGILSDRFTESAESAETSIAGNITDRVLGGYVEALKIIPSVPFGGFGLGVGTNGGAVFLTGEADFLLSENEWSRILLESGPILGLAFLLWRCALTFKIGRFAINQVRAGNTLPLFLFSAGAFILVQGPFGQPTSLGFAVVFGGLCLAARPVEEALVPETLSSPPPRVLRRSKYAERLHGFKGRSSVADRGLADR